MNKKDIKDVLEYNSLLAIKKINNCECDTYYNYDFIYYLLNYLIDILVIKGKKAYKNALNNMDIKAMQQRDEYWLYLLTYHQYTNTVLFIDNLKNKTL